MPRRSERGARTACVRRCRGRTNADTDDWVRRCRGRTNAGLVLAVVAAAVVAAYHWIVRPWHERYGATDDEARMPLPGDELVAEPADQATRAITVHATAAEVWPWLIQIGADRGGFYSYDWLENLFRLGIHSADRIVPEWQHRDVGDLVYADAAGSGGWYVTDVRPNELISMKVGNVKAGRTISRDDPPGWEFLWTFALREQPDGTTRLLIRERTGFGNPVTKLAMAPIGLVSFVMTERMLRGIRDRAERAGQSAP